MTVPVVDHGPSLSVPVGDAVPGSGPPTPPNPVPASIADLNSAVSAAVAALIASAPGALDTLAEIDAQLSSDESAAAALTTAVAGKDPLQRVVTPAVTAPGALAVNKLTPVDATAGAVAMTLPTGQAEGTQIAVAKVDNSTNAVTITGNVRGTAAQTVSLALYREGMLFRADSAGSWWPISDHKTLASLDARFLTPSAAAGTYQQLQQPDSLVINTADSNNNPTQITETWGTTVRVTDLTYNADGSVATQRYTINGVVGATKTFSYSGGVLTSVA